MLLLLLLTLLPHATAVCWLPAPDCPSTIDFLSCKREHCLTLPMHALQRAHAAPIGMCRSLAKSLLLRHQRRDPFRGCGNFICLGYSKALGACLASKLFALSSPAVAIAAGRIPFAFHRGPLPSPWASVAHAPGFGRWRMELMANWVADSGRISRPVAGELLRAVHGWHQAS